MPDGQGRPISFMSRTLTSPESNYSQLDKEGLAVMFGIKRFHKYLYWRKFVICTDHKPLLSLCNEMKAVPNMASPCIQHECCVMLGDVHQVAAQPRPNVVYSIVRVYNATAGMLLTFRHVPVMLRSATAHQPQLTSSVRPFFSYIIKILQYHNNRTSRSSSLKRTKMTPYSSSMTTRTF